MVLITRNNRGEKKADQLPYLADIKAFRIHPGNVTTLCDCIATTISFEIPRYSHMLFNSRLGLQIKGVLGTEIPRMSP